MAQNRSGFSGFAKGLVVGSVLGAAVSLLYEPRNGNGHRGDIPQKGGRSQKGDLQPSTTRVEKATGTGKRGTSGIGWRMVFYVASAVAMISNWRMKKV